MEQFICGKCDKEFKSKRSLGQHKGWCLNPDRVSVTSLDNHTPTCVCCMCKAHRHETPAWNKGLTKETHPSIAAAGVKIAESKAGKTYEEIYGEAYAQEMRNRRAAESTGRFQSDSKRQKVSAALKGKPKSEEHKRKLRENWDANHTVESIQRAGILSRSSYKIGWFNSTKNNTKIWYQSSYELKAYQKLEEDNNVTSYSRCDFKIPFIFEGVQRRYIPDIHARLGTGPDLIIETKPERFKDTPENTSKRTAGIDFCNSNNLEYKYWTELDLDLPLPK